MDCMIVANAGLEMPVSQHVSIIVIGYTHTNRRNGICHADAGLYLTVHKIAVVANGEN